MHSISWIRNLDVFKAQTCLVCSPCQNWCRSVQSSRKLWLFLKKKNNYDVTDIQSGRFRFLYRSELLILMSLEQYIKQAKVSESKSSTLQESTLKKKHNREVPKTATPLMAIKVHLKISNNRDENVFTTWHQYLNQLEPLSWTSWSHLLCWWLVETFLMELSKK